MNKYSIVLLFLLTSCAGHLELSPKKCRAAMGQWSQESSRYDFVVKEKFWVLASLDGDPEVAYLNKILRKKNIECFAIEEMNVSFEHNFFDTVLSVVPFLSRTTVVIKGKFLDDEVTN